MSKQLPLDYLAKFEEFVSQYLFMEQYYEESERRYYCRHFVKDVNKVIEKARNKERNRIVVEVGELVLGSGNANLNLAFAKGIEGANILSHGEVIRKSNDEGVIYRFQHEVLEPYFDKNKIYAQVRAKDQPLVEQVRKSAAQEEVEI